MRQRGLVCGAVPEDNFVFGFFIPGRAAPVENALKDSFRAFLIEVWHGNRQSEAERWEAG
jgi:hypothetical protein